MLYQRRDSLLLRTGLTNVHKDMSQGTCLWTPSPMLDSILGIIIQHLDEVAELAATILPVKLADLGVAVEQVQPALAAATATGADLANAVGLNGHVVDLVLVDRLAAVGWGVKLAAGGGVLVESMRDENTPREGYGTLR